MDDAKLQELSDVREIVDVMNRYTTALDTRNWDDARGDHGARRPGRLREPRRRRRPREPAGARRPLPQVAPGPARRPSICRGTTPSRWTATPRRRAATSRRTTSRRASRAATRSSSGASTATTSSAPRDGWRIKKRYLDTISAGGNMNLFAEAAASGPLAGKRRRARAAADGVRRLARGELLGQEPATRSTAGPDELGAVVDVDVVRRLDPLDLLRAGRAVEDRLRALGRAVLVDRAVDDEERRPVEELRGRERVERQQLVPRVDRHPVLPDGARRALGAVVVERLLAGHQRRAVGRDCREVGDLAARSLALEVLDRAAEQPAVAVGAEHLAQAVRAVVGAADARDRPHARVERARRAPRSRRRGRRRRPRSGRGRPRAARRGSRPRRAGRRACRPSPRAGAARPRCRRSCGGRTRA